MVQKTLAVFVVLMILLLVYFPTPRAQDVVLFGTELRLGDLVQLGDMPAGIATRAFHTVPTGVTSTVVAHAFNVRADTAATSGPQALEGFAYLNHTSGTTSLALATIGNIQHDGAGGTITEARAFTGNVLSLNTGNTTTAKIFAAGGIGRQGGATGTTTTGYLFHGSTFLAGVTNQWGVYIEDLDARNFFGGKVHLGIDTDNASMTDGMTIDMGGADDLILSLESSVDVAHGMTSLAPTEAFFIARKASATEGGVSMQGYTEGSSGVQIHGQVTTVDTGKGTGDGGALLLQAALRSGTTTTSMSANSNLVVIRNNAVATTIFDAEGTLYLNQGANDDQHLYLKSSDVAHGMTGLAETDAYGLFRKASATEGGVSTQGYTEGSSGYQIHGQVTTVDTTKGTGSGGALLLQAALRSGTTTTAMSANSNLLVIRNNAVATAIFDAEGTFYINQGANDDQHFYLKSTDVAHGITDLAETDAYYLIRKASATQGGGSMQGYTEGTSGMQIHALVTTVSTVKTTAAGGAIALQPALKSGTGPSAMSADANLVIINNNATTRFIFDAEGTAHADDVWTDNAFSLNEEYDVLGVDVTEIGTILGFDLGHDNRLLRHTTGPVAGIVGYHTAQLANNFGNVNEKYPFLGLHDYENPLPVTLTGLTPVRSYGQVRRGDLLIASQDRPGYAMPATGEDARLLRLWLSYVGVALQDLDGEGLVNVKR